MPCRMQWYSKPTKPEAPTLIAMIGALRPAFERSNKMLLTTPYLFDKAWWQNIAKIIASKNKLY